MLYDVTTWGVLSLRRALVHSVDASRLPLVRAAVCNPLSEAHHLTSSARMRRVRGP
jgi:hypothetical protein